MSLYKSFPNSDLIKDWGKLITLSESEVTELYESWLVIEDENKVTSKRLFEEKGDKLKESSDYMKYIGIEVFKYKGRGFNTKRNGYLSWYEKNVVDKISEQYPSYSNSIPTAHMGSREINGIEIYNNQSPTNLVQLYNKIKREYNSKLRELNLVSQKLIKSIEYATRHDIPIEGLTEKEIIRNVHEIAESIYLSEEAPDGTLVNLSGECSECSEYIVGEHRCSCGNRRISIAVEGNIVDGFYFYPEGY